MGLDVDEGDVSELVEEHFKELTTEELKKLQPQQHKEVRRQRRKLSLQLLVGSFKTVNRDCVLFVIDV